MGAADISGHFGMADAFKSGIFSEFSSTVLVVCRIIIPQSEQNGDI
jgi:hypothetical protein